MGAGSKMPLCVVVIFERRLNGQYSVHTIGLFPSIVPHSIGVCLLLYKVRLALLCGHIVD